MRRGRKITIASVVAMSIAAMTAVIAAYGGSDSANGGRPSVIVAHSDQLLPSDSLVDWRSFADYLVVLKVASERALPPSKDEVAAGEGYIPRVVELQIKQILWSRSKAVPVPSSFETDLDGWSFHGDSRTPIRLAGEPMMSVGKVYVAPIVHLDVSDRITVAGWSVLSPDSIIPYANGILGDGDRIANGVAGSAVRKAFTGRDADALASALKATEPYPELVPVMDLPPDERMRYLPTK